MSDQIKASDVFAPDLFDTTKAEKYLETIELVELGLRELLTVSQKIMSSMPFNNAKDIFNYNKQLAESLILQKKIEQVEIAHAKATEANEKAKAAAIKNAIALQKEQERQINNTAKAQQNQSKATNQQTKEQAKLNSVFEQTKKQYDSLSKAQIELSVRGRENGKVFKGIKQEADLLRASLDKAEQGAGRFQRNVGNYKSGFSGLSNSVNQLTREMPAFANSMQTGFMAISNNLPIFFDEIKKANAELKALKAQGEQVPSLFKAVASSIFTFGTLLSVGVTLLTMYGKEMVQFVIDLTKGDEAFKLSAERQSEYYSKLKQYHDEEFESVLKLRVLNEKMTQKEADEWREGYKKKTEQIILQEDHNKRLLEIATKFKVDLDKVNGGLTETLTETKRVTPKGTYIESNRDEVARNKQINAAYFEEQKKFNYSVQEMERVSKLKIDEIKAGKDPKAPKDKAFKLTDQDKRVLDSMEMKAENKMEAEENLKNWLEESNREQTENELQNIKTVTDAEIDGHNAVIDDILKLQHAKDEAAKKDKERLQQELNSTLNFADQIAKAKNDSLQTQLNNDLEMRQRNILQQQQLAMAGKDNTLAFEKEAATKDELAKQELAKKQEKQAKALAFLKLLAAYADKGSTDDAVAKTLVQMAIAGAITGSYKDGVEAIDGDGTETSDSILARLSKNESVVTAKGTRENAGLPTAMNKGKVDEYFEQKYLPKYLTENGGVGFAENTMNSMFLKQFTTMNEKIVSIEKALKERPVHQTHRDHLGNEIDTKIINGFKKRTTRKSNSPLNYI